MPLATWAMPTTDLGEMRRAIEYYEQLLAIAREIGDRRVEGNALFNMSLALDELGDLAQAILNAEAPLKIYEQIESPYATSAQTTGRMARAGVMVLYSEILHYCNASMCNSRRQ